MISQDSYMISDAERIRLSTAKALAHEAGESTTQLIDMLADTSWVVRRSVVDSLARQGNRAVGPLCEVLRTKRDDEARLAAAVDALVFSRGRPENELQVLAMDTDPAVITDALQIMGRRRSQAAIPTLVKLTAHESDVVAVGAIEALGRIGGRAAVEALIETVKSGSFYRTFPAIDILGRSGDRRVVEPLTTLLDNPHYLPEAVRALGRTGERAAVRPLVKLLKSKTDSVVRLAAVALWDLRVKFEEKSGGEDEAIDDLLKNEVTSDLIARIGRVMSSFDIIESVGICNLFGAIRSVEAAPLLAAKLDAPQPVAESAAAALRRIGKDSDAHLLTAIREGDSTRRKLLLPIVTRSTIADEVVNCLRDTDPDVRALACETIARLGNSRAVSSIFKLLEDTNLRVVHAATAALQALGTRESRELAALGSKSENPGVRRAALRILAYFGDAGALQPILDGLNDPDPRVREVAIQGLPYLEDPIAYSALCDATKSTDARTRALAVRSLAQLPKSDERTYSMLLRSLGDSDAWVRYYACQSLGRLAYAPASVEIATLLHDEAGQVRVAAVEALSHMETRHAHRALQQAATFSEPDIQRAALVGLGIMHRIEDLPIVLTALSSEDVTTRLIALSAVVSFQSPLVLGALSNAAADANEQIRTAAIDFLAARSEVEATEILVQLLSVEATRERAKAALIIPQLSRSSGLLIALESASDELAPILVSILLRSTRPDARKALISAMKLNNVAARKAAATGLAAQRDAEKLAVLKEAADNDPDQGVRDICVLLLSE